jgi:hypothetical protein
MAECTLNAVIKGGGVTGEQTLLCAILFAAVVLFAWGKWRHDVVAVAALYDAYHRLHRRSGGDQGDPGARRGQSAPAARTAVAVRPGATCAGLKCFTQCDQFMRIFP